MYAVYHGPDGLRAIAAPDPPATPPLLAAGLRAGGVERACTTTFFDTVPVRVPGRAAEVVAAARGRGVNLRLVDADHGRHLHRRDHDPRRTSSAVWAAFGVDGARRSTRSTPATADALPGRRCAATTAYLTHPVFHTHHSRDRDAALPAPARRPATTRSTAA